MKLTWKHAAIGLGGLVGVIVLAAVLFVVFFPKDLAAREAERRIEEATQRDLTLGQNIELTFFPALGFSVDNVSLSNPRDFDDVARRGGTEAADVPFLAADRVVFAVALLPLLSGDVQVKNLMLEGAEVRLRERGDRVNNWTFPTEENESTIEDLRLDNVQLIDSLITFQAAGSAEPLTLSDVDARLTLESLDQAAALDAQLDYRGQRLDLDAEVGLPRAVMEKGETPITAELRSGPLNASFNGALNAETGALAGALDASGQSLRDLMAWFGSPMGEGGGFNAFSVRGQMAREGQTTSLTDAALRLDAINANGDLQLVNQENGRLRVTGALTAPAVDLNIYLPAPAEQRGDGVQVSTAWSQERIDLSGLRALDADLTLGLGTLRFQRMSFSDVALALRVANGALDARLNRISLYQGAGTARLIADGSGATPRIAIELNAQNVQAETLLRDAIGFDRIAGRGRLTASLIGTGTSQAAIMRSLRGNASFNFNDGEWKGVNLAQVARTVQATLSGQAVGPGASTDFAELSSTFTVADGIMATDNLRMLNPYVRLEGRGVVNIGAQTLDMRLAPRAVNNAQGQGGDLGVGGIGIPFRVSGPWSRVSFRPALEDVVQDQLRQVLSQRESGDPMARLGEALFGRTPAATTPAAETPATPEDGAPAAEQPAQQQEQQEQRPRNPLEELLRRAQQSKQEGEAAPTP